MRRLLLLSVLATIALGALSASSMASRVSFTPSGAIRASTASFRIEGGAAAWTVDCEWGITGEIVREAEGTLRLLGSIVAGRFTRVSVANCRGGTMRVELLTAATISVKEVTNRSRAELWVLEMKILIEDAGRRYRCLYNFLMFFRIRENPISRFELIIERVLEVRPLVGSETCNPSPRALGTFAFGAAIEAILV